MNSDTQNTIQEILEETGAIVACSICCSNYIHAYDHNAEKMAYAQATNARKDGDRGFRSMSREEVVSYVKMALDSASNKCPSCDLHS